MKKKRLCLLTGILLVCAVLTGTAGLSAAAETLTGWYENEWNYLDGSMDISQGIPANATGVLGKIQRSGVLRVAVDPENAPWVYRVPGKTDDDGLAGTDVMLARLIAEKMGATLKFVLLESTQILPALTEDHCDLTICGVTYTPGRALAYTMSKGYYYPEEGDSIGILLPEDSDIVTLEDLSGRILVAERNSIPEAYGARHIPSYREFRRVSSTQAVFESVQQEKADAAIVNLARAETYLRNNPGSDLRLAEGLTFSPDEPCRGDRVAAKKGETQLIAFVNGVIDEVTRNGLYETWMEEARTDAVK